MSKETAQITFLRPIQHSIHATYIPAQLLHYLSTSLN